MIVADPLRADIPDSLVALDALLAQAHAHADRGDLREAVEAAERALAIARAEQDAERVARAYSILGQARRASADYPRSLAASQEALEWLERAGVDRGRGQCVLLIGQVYLDLGDYDRSLASLSESLAIATEVGAKTRARNAHEELAKTCEAMGDMGRALTHFKAFHALDREVHGVETRRAAQAHLMKVEIERVQREAEFHRRQNADLSLANEKLAREARQDELTGLANRREFDRALAVAFDAAVAGDRSLAIVLFDVDHFKRTNDRHTHVVGDAVLQEIAATLTAACRATDGAFRYGGEEFVLLLRDAGRIEAVTIAERVRGAVAARDWNGLSTGLLVTMSAGVAAGTRFASAAEMLRTADEQLYRAKRNGRNRVCAA